MRVDKVGIVIDLDAAGVADVNEDIFVLRIDVLQLAAPPFRFIDDLGQHEERFDRIEHFADVKRRVRCPLAAGEQIGEILSGAPFGHQPRTQIVASAAQLVNFDLRISALESMNRFFSQRPSCEIRRG